MEIGLKTLIPAQWELSLFAREFISIRKSNITDFGILHFCFNCNCMHTFLRYFSFFFFLFFILFLFVCCDCVCAYYVCAFTDGVSGHMVLPSWINK